MQFQWVGRSGEPQQLVGEPGPYYTFDLSADASRLVVGRAVAGYTQSAGPRPGAGCDEHMLTFGTSYSCRSAVDV